MSQGKQHTNYTANTAAALNALDGRAYVTGLSLTVRTAGQKGQRGNAITHLPIIGVCPEGSTNPFAAKALKSQEGGYIVLPDSDGLVIGHRTSEGAREAATSILRERGNAKLATFTPEQRGILDAIKALQSTIRQLSATIETMKSSNVDTTAVEGLLKTTQEQVQQHRAQLRAI